MLVLRVKDDDGIIVAGLAIRATRAGGGVKLAIEGDKRVRVIRFAHVPDVDAAREQPWLFQLQERCVCGGWFRLVGEWSQDEWSSVWVNRGRTKHSLDEIVEQSFLSPADENNLRVIDAVTGLVVYPKED